MLIEAHEHLRMAIEEPVADLSDDRKGKVLRSSQRLMIEAMKPLETRPIASVYRALTFWVQDLCERDVIEIGQDSHFYQGYTILADAMQTNDKTMEIIDMVERSAKKAFLRLREWLELRGYFKLPVWAVKS